MNKLEHENVQPPRRRDFLLETNKVNICKGLTNIITAKTRERGFVRVIFIIFFTIIRRLNSPEVGSCEPQSRVVRDAE